MTGGTITVLIVLWLGVLLPGAVRDWRRSPVATVDTFAEAMARLSRVDGAAGRPVVVPGAPGRRVVHPPRATQRRLRARRRGIVVRLLALTLGTSMLAAVVGGPVLWALASVCGLVLLAYLGMLRLLAVRAAQARRVVRHHPAAHPARPRAPALGPTQVLLPVAVGAGGALHPAGGGRDGATGARPESGAGPVAAPAVPSGHGRRPSVHGAGDRVGAPLFATAD